MAEYAKSSPYFTTDVYGNFLDVLNNRSIPSLKDDVFYTIDRVYQYRPDLLAFDLYQDPGLWWVFIARNPNVLKDPLGDFVAGQVIRIPKKDTLVNTLGI